MRFSISSKKTLWVLLKSLAKSPLGASSFSSPTKTSSCPNSPSSSIGVTPRFSLIFATRPVAFFLTKIHEWQ